MRDDYVNKTAGPNLLVSDLLQPRLPLINFKGDRWNVSRDDDETLSLEIGVAGVLYKEYLDSTISYDAGLFRLYTSNLLENGSFEVSILGLENDAHNLITITVFVGDGVEEAKFQKDVYNGIKVFNDIIFFETNEETEVLNYYIQPNTVNNTLTFVNNSADEKTFVVITKVDRVKIL